MFKNILVVKSPLLFPILFIFLQIYTLIYIYIFFVLIGKIIDQLTKTPKNVDSTLFFVAKTVFKSGQLDTFFVHNAFFKKSHRRLGQIKLANGQNFFAKVARKFREFYSSSSDSFFIVPCIFSPQLLQYVGTLSCPRLIC